jgi:hypothetical protein
MLMALYKNFGRAKNRAISVSIGTSPQDDESKNGEMKCMLENCGKEKRLWENKGMF